LGGGGKWGRNTEKKTLLNPPKKCKPRNQGNFRTKGGKKDRALGTPKKGAFDWGSRTENVGKTMGGTEGTAGDVLRRLPGSIAAMRKQKRGKQGHDCPKQQGEVNLP